MAKILFLIVGLIIGICELTGILGMLLPNPRISTKTFQVSAPISIVWDQITDHKNQTKWRKV